jgi:hypothetical protein
MCGLKGNSIPFRGFKVSFQADQGGMARVENVSDDSLEQFLIQLILLEEMGEIPAKRASLNALLVWSVRKRDSGVTIDLAVCGAALKRLIRGKSRTVGAIRPGVANKIDVELGHGFGF